MKKEFEKPSPEAKALSLFLMAYKSKDPEYKEKSKRINKQWDLLKTDKISKTDYMTEVQSMLDLYGGYEGVIEKTILYYVEKTGEWKSSGDDQYSKDAQAIAKRILK
ncbi:MAG: hypothetical protein ACPGVD_02925 [Flavobacteriales bacterium]